MGVDELRKIKKYRETEKLDEISGYYSTILEKYCEVGSDEGIKSMSKSTFTELYLL